MIRPWTHFRSMRAISAAFLLGLSTLVACGAGNNETKASNDPVEIVLVRMEPADGESSVPRNRVVRLYFNTLVLPNSVTDQSIQLRTGGTFQTRPEGSFLVNGEIVEFDPTVTRAGGPNAAGFPAGGQIQVIVPILTPGSTEPANNFVQNVEGNPVTTSAGDNTIVFTTGSGWIDPVSGPPGVLGLEFTPAPNTANQVSPYAAVTVIFDEPMNPSSILLGNNIFLTNNTDTSNLYQFGVPSITFADGSLTRFTFDPVFGFGQGPFNVKVNFIDPLNPGDFETVDLPTDLGGNLVGNFTFLATFDTQFDPSLLNTGLLIENFVDPLKRDPANTDAVWGDDSEFPFSLISQPISTRTEQLDVVTIANFGDLQTDIDNLPLATPTRPIGNEDYCATTNPLVGPDLPIFSQSQPPTADGRRRMNLYRAGEIAGNGTITRMAWGPDSDAIFASTYGGTRVNVGHHKADTPLTNAGMFQQFDVDGYVTVAGPLTYRVDQAANLGGVNLQDGYFDWPDMQTFFDYDGENDLLVDVEAMEGTTWNAVRTFLAVIQVPGWPVTCDCVTIFAGACNVRPGAPFRQADSTHDSDILNPQPSPATANPAPFVDIMEFDLAKLRSDAQSLWYDSLVDEPDYLTPIFVPVVQPGGSTIDMAWSGSTDSITEDVPFSPNINAVDGFRYIRFSVILRSNIFTLARPRIENLQIPYTFE